MSRSVLRNVLVGAATLSALSAGRVPAQPIPDSTSGGFVLFADQELRTTGLTVHGGTVAVNDGELAAVHGKLVAPDSDVVANTVRLDRGSQCATLFSNDAVRTSPGCNDPQAFDSPLVEDFAASCGYPETFPACNPGLPIVVDHDATQTLAPGTYGEVRLKDDATLRLENGTYVFCRISTARRARILAGATTIQVAGDVRLGNGAQIGGTSSAITENDTVLQVSGRTIHFSRQSRVQANICAPNANLSLANGSVHRGCFTAATIRSSRADVTVCRATTTTTTTAPTTTTLATTTTTLASTTTTAAPTTTIASTTTTAAPTTTTIASTTTTAAPTTTIATTTSTTEATTSTTTSTTVLETTTTSTTTTTDPCAGACGNGTVDGQCGEVCDTALEQTPCGSPQGAFVACVDDCTALDDSACTGTVNAQ